MRGVRRENVVKGVDVVAWEPELLTHLMRHGSYFTFCSLEPPLKRLTKRFPLYKLKNDAPTCIVCTGRAICGSKF